MKKLACMLFVLVFLCACAAPEPAPGSTQTPPPVSATPQPTKTLAEEPILKVYIKEEDTIREMLLEEYLLGVVAGEMKNDWPQEALNAQAIIARTFVVMFLEDKGGSMYEGADISTDTAEAQAYNEEGINDAVREAVESTRGQILTYDGQPIYAWFYSHSGGATALAGEGLEYKEDPPYIHSVAGREDDDAPEDVQRWNCAFSFAQIITAASELGVRVNTVESFTIAEEGPSGRAVRFALNGQSLPAASFRMAIGADELRSTLISDIELTGSAVLFSGAGYGHGVGMSQWGAYAMANEGESAQDIIEYYYKNVEIEKIWQ